MKNKMLFTLVLSAMILQGCFDQFEQGPEIGSRIAETQQRAIQRAKAKRIETIANVLSLGDSSLFYIQQGRDPFVATGIFDGVFTPGEFGKVGGTTIRLKKDPSRPDGYKPGPYEKYEVNALTMTGVMSLANGETAALVDVGNNKIMTIRKGDYVGRDHGKVTKITEKDMQFTEKFGSTNRDDPNAWIELPNKIDLKMK